MATFPLQIVQLFFFFKISRVKAVDDIDKLCKFHENSDHKCRQLTLYHTIPTSNNPKGENFGKHCGKTRNCW